MRNGFIMMAAVAIAGVTPAAASEWHFITASGEKPARTVIFIDKQSVREAGGVNFDVWEYGYYESPLPAFYRARYVKSQFRFDCARGTRALENMAYYSVKDEVLGSDHFDFNNRSIKAIVPDTVADAELKSVCGTAKFAELIVPHDTNPQIYAAGLLVTLDRNSSK